MNNLFDNIQQMSHNDILDNIAYQFGYSYGPHESSTTDCWQDSNGNIYINIDGYQVHPIEDSLDSVSRLTPTIYNTGVHYNSTFDTYESYFWPKDTDPVDTINQFTGKSEKEARFKSLLAMLLSIRDKDEKAPIR